MPQSPASPPGSVPTRPPTDEPARAAGVARWARDYAEDLRRFLAKRRIIESDIKDVCQEVYLRLLRFDRGEVIQNPQAYLYRVAANVAHDFRLRQPPWDPMEAEQLDQPTGEPGLRLHVISASMRRPSVSPLSRIMSPSATLKLYCLMVAALAATPTKSAPLEPSLDAKVYERAARFVPENRDTLVLNGSVTAHWQPGGRDRFSYRRALGDGRAEFILVEAATGARRRAFDHAVVADGLRRALGRPIDPERLPFKDYLEVGNASIQFVAGVVTWTCSTSQHACAVRDTPAAVPTEVASPNGMWFAFVKENNLWVRSADGREYFPITHDGQPHYAYGMAPEADLFVVPGRLRGQPANPVLLWAPDSQRIFTQRLDERNVREITLVQSTPADGGFRPNAFTWRYAMPNDPTVPMAEPWVFDVATRTGHRVEIDPVPTVFTTSIEAKETWWSADASRIFLLVRGRYYKTMTLYEVDPVNGRARVVVSETGSTFVEPAAIGQRPMVYTLADGSVIWFSERDGRGHLYLYDGATGHLKRRLTEGNWSVRGVVHVDEARGSIFVAATEKESGSDPYFRKIYRVGLTDERVTLLTPEEADHAVASAQESNVDPPADGVASASAVKGFAPSGRYFIESISRPDLPPRTVLRRADGHLIAEIEHADVSRLATAGLTAPERFTAFAADQKTILYGNILRPSDFDPHKSYAVIDSIYPGPQRRRVEPRFLDNVFDRMSAQTFAELGFIVVLVDGRGTPGRSKAFLDESYGKLGLAGHLDDHVAVIRQLALQHGYIDISRVGIYGASGGGYAALHAMLKYPDFYKVGVADAGNHDQRGYLAVWGESYNGLEVARNYLDAANAPLAHELKGKLLLIHGGMDYNVLPDQTLQVVDALIKSNKDFDLLIVPNAHHTTITAGGYSLRRAWDFFVKNLMGLHPPEGYDLSAAEVSN
jgi:dipeptidyl-peptidase-4